MEVLITVLMYVLIGILGIEVGSFLNVLIYRIPKKEEWVKTRSHCMSCGHQLAWYDNIPLFSWLFLRGKCRYCKVKISAQYPIVEASNGVIWLLIMILNGINLTSAMYCFACSMLLALSIIDFRTFEIEDGFHIAIGACGIINLLFHLDMWQDYVIGMFAVSIPILLIFLISKGSAIGGGDVKLMAACGLLVGWKLIIVGFLFGCIIGAITHLIRMKVSGEGKVLAMGPYLSIGVFVAMLVGNYFINWYQTLFIV